MKSSNKRLPDFLELLQRGIDILKDAEIAEEGITKDEAGFPWEEHISEFGEELDEFAKKKEKKTKPVSKAKLRELDTLHAALTKAKKRLSDFEKSPPTLRKDLDVEISAIQSAMVDVLKSTGLTRLEAGRYIYSLRKTPTYYRVVSEQTAIKSLRKRKLGRYIKVTEALDMAKLKGFLKHRGITIPGLKKMTGDVSIYVYERHEEDEPELVYIVGPEGLEEDFEEDELEDLEGEDLEGEDLEGESSSGEEEEFSSSSSESSSSSKEGEEEFEEEELEEEFAEMKFLVDKVKNFLTSKSVVYTQRSYNLANGEVNAVGIGRAFRQKVGEVTPELLRKHLGESGFETVEEWNKAKFGKDKKMWLYKVTRVPKGGPSKTMAIVGSRDATPDMLKAARYQTKKALDAGWGIVTGGAKGIDEEAIRETLRQNACKKLTVYLPKTINDQPVGVRPLLKKVREAGADVIENVGIKRVAKETGKAVSEVSYGQAAFARNKTIVAKSDALTAVQKAGSKGTQHSINAALKKEIPVKQIDEKLNARLLKQIMNKLKITHLGNLGKFLKGTLKMVPGVLPILEAVDLGLLWKDMENLKEDIEAGTANEQQQKIWDWMQQKKEASEGEDWGEINLEEEFEEELEEEFTEEKFSGLYLTSPHSEYIHAGTKTAIVKSTKFTEHINEPLYLISDKQCWGIIKLSEPKEINQEEFDERYEEHLIENYERVDWWQETFPLYLYEVEVIEKFESVREVEIPEEIQVFVKPENLIFK